MGDSWCILTKRFGADIRHPSFNDLEAAVREIIDPAHTRDREHADICVRYGYDEGPMYVLTYAIDQSLIFEQWADQDFEAELEPAGSRSNVPPAEAVRLMHL